MRIEIRDQHEQVATVTHTFDPPLEDSSDHRKRAILDAWWHFTRYQHADASWSEWRDRESGVTVANILKSGEYGASHRGTMYSIYNTQNFSAALRVKDEAKKLLPE